MNFKKIVFYILVIIVLVYLFPVIFTSRFSNENCIVTETQIKEPQKSYDYKSFSKVNLLNTTTNETMELSLDEYLYGVVSAEMPADYEMEALKAQAVVARTYTIYQMSKGDNKHGPMTICDSYSCCQAWISKENRFQKWEPEVAEENWNKIVEAVESTKGEVIEYNGEVIDAFFHANSGGVTERPEDVWGGTNYPYLQTVETAGEENYSQYSSEVILSREEFVSKLKEHYANLEIDWENPECIKVEELTNSNRIRKIKVGNLSISGVEMRSIFGLKSANFSVVLNENNVEFKVIGYGHGVGMSQTGANTMAKDGASYKDIINHFYAGVEITKI